MKREILFLLTCLVVGVLAGCSRTGNVVELPIVIKNGTGPTGASFGGYFTPYDTDTTNPWFKTYLRAKGAPTTWTDMKQGDINVDIYQVAYQSYWQGNISQERYEELQNAWDWTPDTLALSKKPIKAQVAFAYGKDESGKTMMVIDANNNLDLSDDAAFEPMELKDSMYGRGKDSLFLPNAVTLSYERFANGRIVEQKIPIVVAFLREHNIFVAAPLEYVTVELKGHEMAVSQSSLTVFGDGCMSSLVPMTKEVQEAKTSRELWNYRVPQEGYLVLDDDIYRYKGIRNEKVLLEKINQKRDEIYSTQIGFKAFPFGGKNFVTGDTISLSDYKGKYVLLDFWAVWCGPCIREIPKLKEFYTKADKSKVEILSIVGDSSSESLKKLIDEHGITWSQILSTPSNNIKKLYNVNGYPTTLLVNPEGVIVAKHLYGENLEKEIEEAMKQ